MRFVGICRRVRHENDRGFRRTDKLEVAVRGRRTVKMICFDNEDKLDD